MMSQFENPTPQALGEIPKGLDFRSGNIVSIQNKAGEVEGGWTIKEFDGETGNAILEKEGATTEVSRMELETVNFEAIKTRIASSEEFSTLSKALLFADVATRGVPTSGGDLKSSEYWQDRIDELRKSHPGGKKEKGKENFITNTAKLRTKAVELMKNGQALKEARDFDELVCGLEWAEDVDGNKKEGYFNLLQQIFVSHRFNLIANLPEDHGLRGKALELVLNDTTTISKIDEIFTLLGPDDVFKVFGRTPDGLKARIGIVAGQIQKKENPDWNLVPRVLRKTIRRILEK